MRSLYDNAKKMSKLKTSLSGVPEEETAQSALTAIHECCLGENEDVENNRRPRRRHRETSVIPKGSPCQDWDGAVHLISRTVRHRFSLYFVPLQISPHLVYINKIGLVIPTFVITAIHAP